MTGKILVIGATGRVGSGVVRELAQRNATVVAAVRDPDAPRARALGVPLTLFDLEKPQTWRSSLTGVRKVFLVARPGDDEPQRLANPFIDEMQLAGVRHVVNLTAMGVQTREDIGLRQVERHLEASTLPYTHLRPNFFMQIFSEGSLLAGIRTSNRVAVPAGNALLSFIDARDISAVAAAVLLGSGHEYKAYTLTGAEAIDHATVAATLSQAVGRELRYEALDETLARVMLGEAGFPPPRIERLIGFYRLVRSGLCSPVTDEVSRLLGRAPASFTVFARDHREVWQ